MENGKLINRIWKKIVLYRHCHYRCSTFSFDAYCWFDEFFIRLIGRWTVNRNQLFVLDSIKKGITFLIKLFCSKKQTFFRKGLLISCRGPPRNLAIGRFKSLDEPQASPGFLRNLHCLGIETQNRRAGLQDESENLLHHSMSLFFSNDLSKLINIFMFF